MDFSNFFANLTSVDSLVILILWVLAFLLGILLGSALRGGTIRRLRKDLETRQNELTAAQGEVTRLTDELHLREADLRKAQFEVEEQRSKATRLTDEKTKLYNEIYTLNSEVENLRKAAPDTTVATNLQTTIDQLNREISTLQTRNAALEQELAQLRTTPMPEPSEQPFDYIADFQSTQNALRTRLEALEGKLNQLATENEDLRQEVQSLKSTDATHSPLSMERSLAAAAPLADTEPEWNLGVEGVPQAPLLEPSDIRRDDLTRIEGIGPFLERQLNDIGIYNYEQISRWDGADINSITQQIRYFPGRIEREDWVGQAQRLLAAQPDTPANYETTSSTDTYAEAPRLNALYPADHTDLTVIEGIGPRIEAILRNADINTWDDLAEADLDELAALLDAHNLSFHNPATWTAQARLAAGGHWELLKEYQEQLKGGRDAS